MEEKGGTGGERGTRGGRGRGRRKGERAEDSRVDPCRAAVPGCLHFHPPLPPLRPGQHPTLNLESFTLASATGFNRSESMFGKEECAKNEAKKREEG